jgi:hypothetical protein
MTNETTQQATGVDAGKSPTAFMEAKINQLKGRLEEKQARSHTSEQWEGMIEDCEIILKHLESKTQ